MRNKMRGFMVGPVVAVLVGLGSTIAAMVGHPATVDSGPVYHNYNGGFTK